MADQERNQAVISSRQPFEPEMILIPAGEFLMGSAPQQDEHAQNSEEPQHSLYLPSFYLAKAPVTNTQYKAFVLATSREVPKGWTNRNPPGGQEDHPVVNVTWYDARDYCQWLSGVTGRGYALPSEAEWEKGARGTDGRIYPWGNRWDATLCNSGESGPDKTISVHAYPQGASPYGVLDMAGNVWEWTRSLWGPFAYPYRPTDGRENLDASVAVDRMERGGAFNCARWFVRCACHTWDHPNVPQKTVGFRVMMRP